MMRQIPIIKIAAVFCAINLCAAGNVHSQQEITRPATLSAKIPTHFEGPVQKKFKELVALDKEIEKIRADAIGRWHREAMDDLKEGARYIRSVLPDYNIKKIRRLIGQLSDTDSPSEEIMRRVVRNYPDFISEFIDSKNYHHIKRKGLKPIRYLIWLHRVYPRLLEPGGNFGLLSRDYDLNPASLYGQLQRNMKLPELIQKTNERKQLAKELFSLQRPIYTKEQIHRLLQVRDRKWLELDAAGWSLPLLLETAEKYVRQRMDAGHAGFDLTEFRLIAETLAATDGNSIDAARLLDWHLETWRESIGAYKPKISLRGKLEAYKLKKYQSVLKWRKRLRKQRIVMEMLVNMNGNGLAVARIFEVTSAGFSRYQTINKLVNSPIPLNQLDENDFRSKILLDYLRSRPRVEGEMSAFVSA